MEEICYFSCFQKNYGNYKKMILYVKLAKLKNDNKDGHEVQLLKQYKSYQEAAMGNHRKGA